jgi:Peptidase_C39 like family
MSNSNQNTIILDVPYFQQTRTATCGPACLMMVMRYWDHSLELSQKLEFQLWKQSFSLFFLGGTFQYGLASTAASHSFHPEIYQKTRFSEGYTKFPQLASLLENMVSYKATRLKIPIHYKRDSIQVIHEALSQKIPPIVFITLQPLLGENVLHWVVVTGVDEHMIYVHDPYVPSGYPGSQKKNHPVPRELFSQAMKTQIGRMLRLPSCVVLIKP